MIQLFFSAFFCANLLATDISSSNEPTRAHIQTRQGKTLVATDWEAATAWNRVEDKNLSTTYYTHKRNFPAEATLSDRGLVLVFARGYSLARGPEKPLGLPFTYFANDVSTQGYSWYQNINDEGVEVQLAVPAALESTFAANKNAIQFRYFIMAPRFFEEKGLTPAQVKSLSYKKIVELLGTPE